ncbi:E3 ubiquitin-protein ligase E3D isoform X3 [Carcharodon carcharias]|uniref:E3 ubiquitin-protein ligase E3D isoform X3 n=1 Tax=Carcharodon carcharias TaxID=13397 RepID=UPI001B7E1AF3|nr:E3 ubiquitin-protein ligase E3D isoform X3 [Carcharodon carcharias]
MEREMQRKLIQPLVFLEIRNSTQSGQLIIGNFPENYSELQVTLGLSSIHLQSAGQCINLDLPVGVRIVPPSCRSLQYVMGDGFHMRLQVQIDRPAELVPTVIKTLKAQASYMFQCQTCGQSVLKKQMFQRVLPLPSGNWNDLVEHWCCHPDPFTKALQPRLDDCLLGDMFLLLNVASIDNTAVHEEKASQSEARQSADNTGTHLVQIPRENNTVVCTRCRKMLGDVTSSDTIKFYVTEVLVQPLASKALKRQICERSLFVETVFAGRLKELSSAQSTFRFCIQGCDGKTYILLWLLNSDTLLVRSHNDSKSDFAAIGKDTVKPESSNKFCEGNNAVKVLYHPCLKERNKILCAWSAQQVGSQTRTKVRLLRLQEKWEKNIGVHGMTLPVNTCLQLLLILASSTASLPLSLQNMNSFKPKSVAGPLTAEISMSSSRYQDT